MATIEQDVAALHTKAKKELDKATTKHVQFVESLKGQAEKSAQEVALLKARVDQLGALAGLGHTAETAPAKPKGKPGPKPKAAPVAAAPAKPKGKPGPKPKVKAAPAAAPEAKVRKKPGPKPKAAPVAAAATAAPAKVKGKPGPKPKAEKKAETKKADAKAKTPGKARAAAGLRAVQLGLRPPIKEAMAAVMGDQAMNSQMIHDLLKAKDQLPNAQDPKGYIGYLLSSSKEHFKRCPEVGRGYYKSTKTATTAPAVSPKNGKAAAIPNTDDILSEAGLTT